jgi:hypothetical protein
VAEFANVVDSPFGELAESRAGPTLRLSVTLFQPRALLEARGLDQ